MFQQRLIIAVSPPPQFVDLCPNCESSKAHEQNYIQLHDTLSIFPAKSFHDANRPNHFRMRIWPIAVFATKSYLQAFRQKHRPQWLWRTRPNFLPQFAQRFSNLVMKLSTDLEADGTTPTRRSDPCPRSALTMCAAAAPEACFSPPILCYFGPTDCLPQFSHAWG